MFNRKGWYSPEKLDLNNPENSSTTKVGKHIPSSFSMPTISSFKSIENKHDVYRGKDCMKKFFKKKKIKLQMNSRNHIKMQKFVIFVKKNLKTNMLKLKNIVYLGTFVIIQGNIEVLNIAYVA